MDLRLNFMGSFYLLCVYTQADKGDVGVMASPMSEYYSTPCKRVLQDAELQQLNFLDILWTLTDLQMAQIHPYAVPAQNEYLCSFQRVYIRLS